MTKALSLPSIKAAVLSIAIVGTLGACALDSRTGDRTMTGAAVGAASGAAVGLLRGDFLSSTLTGAAAGGAGGFVYDQIQRD